MGVRSLAVRLEMDGIEVLIDPGAGVIGEREDQPLHPKEYRALKEAHDRIDRVAETADVIVVTHYHYDHYVPPFENHVTLLSSPARSRRLFSDAHVVAKHPNNDINQSQSKRGRDARQVISNACESATWADGKLVEHGPVTVRLSPPVPHGPDGTRLGYVLMVAVEGSEGTVCFASDTLGPVELESTDWLLDRNPDIVIADGPPTYLSPKYFPEENHERAREQLIRLAKAADLLIDHHLLRDRSYRSFLEPIKETGADHDHRAQTFAEYRGEPNRPLEAKREELNDRFPVDESFYRRLVAGEFVDGEDLSSGRMPPLEQFSESSIS